MKASTYKEYIINLENLSSEIEKIVYDLLDFRFWLIVGQMGSGKTTFVRAIAQCLGAEEEASSPTYTLINEYHFPKNKFEIKTFHHLDLYRISDIDEVMSIGFEELLRSDVNCVIEWPELVLSLLEGESVIFVYISTSGEGERKYTLTTNPYESSNI